MVTEAAVARIAIKIATAILKNPTVKNAALRRIGRDPLSLAVKRALHAAYRDLEAAFPQWVDALFDESFLEHEGAPHLVDVVTRGRAVAPAELARSYVRSLTPNDRQALVREVEPAAVLLLDSFTRAIRADPAVAAALDSKALDSVADDLAAIRAAIGAGRATEGVLWDYLKWTIDRNLYLDPRGTFQTQRQVQLKLDRVYVSLDASPVGDLTRHDKDEVTLADDPDADVRTDRPDDHDGRTTAHPHPTPGRSARPDRAERTDPAVISLLDAVAAHPHLVVLGGPGTGKTTLLRHLALRNAQRIWSDGLAAAAAGARLPILVRIAEYADSGAWRRSSLTDFLPEYHRMMECSATALADLFERELDAGHCTVLLDGLDEISLTDERIGIVGRIEDFVRRHTRAGNTFVVTSRESGYRTAALGGEFVHVRARDMSREQVELFLQQWCQAVEDAETPELPLREREAVANREITAILRAVDASPGVARLAVNPLMLRVLALIHRTGARLPQKRIELYKIAADTLARTWRLAQGVPESALAKPEHVTRLLSTLALWMHVNRPSGVSGEADVLAVLGREWARINGQPWDGDDLPLGVESEVRSFLDAVRIQTGLFVERAPGRYGFLHLTFEEYFAARALIARPRTRAAQIRTYLHDPRWVEPILLALGFIGLDYPEDAAELVEAAVLATGEAAEEAGLGPSPLEEWLGQDFLFALRCMGDEIPVAPHTARRLVGQAVRELFSQAGRGRFTSYRLALRDLLASLLSTRYADLLVDAARQAPSTVDERRTWPATVAEVPGLADEPTVRDRLLELSGDPDEQVRVAAASVLAGAVEHPDVLARLLELTHDPADPVAGAATDGLASAVDRPGVLGRLLELADAPHGVARIAAVRALAAAAERPEVAARFHGLSRDGDPGIREYAVEGLRRAADDTAAVGRLLELACDPDEIVRIWAGDVLATSAARADRPGMLPSILDAAGGDDPRDRTAAATALRYAVNRPGVLRRVLELTDDPDPEVRVAAITALGRADDPGVHPRLLGLTHDPDPQVRVAAIDTLDPAVDGLLPRLLELTRDPDREVRRTAARLLHDSADEPDVFARLVELVDDPDEGMRSRAAQALAQAFDRPDVLAHLLALAGDPTATVRRAAASALGSALDRTGVLPALLDLADSPDEHVRSVVAQALADAAGQPEVLDRLGGLLADERVDGLLDVLRSFVRSDAPFLRRAAAVSVLAYLYGRRPWVLDLLMDVLVDDDNDVRKAAVRAIVDIGQLSADQRTLVRETLCAALTRPEFDARDKYEKRTAADYAYDALWALEVAAGSGSEPDEPTSSG